ncbi:MAG TPA: triose-phosphate isomerase, partial [Pyrinomonadaceae bacterium]|nr:triose-phosphate isomerase [Pyrinomonadaceae bacterium]
GEVAPSMLKDAGCSHAIIGHSERRQFYGETDISVNQKTKSALAAGLTAIVCVGEMLDQREAGNAANVVKAQLISGLDGLTVADMERIIIAYEPVWAIGTGKVATPEQAQEMHAFIRATVAESHSPSVSEATRILYGGSVKPDNIAGLMTNADIDGALVGGASLDAESFSKIVNYK